MNTMAKDLGVTRTAASRLCSFIFALISAGALIFLTFSEAAAQGAAQNPPGTSAAIKARTPSDTVREFFKAMREHRIRDAFAMSIFQPAIEGLKPDEFAELQPDFEKAAGKVPEKVEITGEQITGDVATVFMNLPRDDNPALMEAAPIPLMQVNGQWIIGDKDNQEVVKKAGNRFFPEARIETHHNEVMDMLKRLPLIQLAYSQQHNGAFADLPTLISAGLVPKDIEGTDSTGYRFHINLAKDAKSYLVSAEPAVYGRTGRLSFSADHTGKIKSADTGGKPLN